MIMKAARGIERINESTFSEGESHLKVPVYDEEFFEPAVWKSNRKTEEEQSPAVWSSRRTVESQDTEALQSEKPETAQIYKFPSNEPRNLEINNDSEVDSDLDETVEMLKKRRDELHDEIGLRSIRLSRLSPDSVDVPRITEEKETFHRELDELEEKLIQKNQTEILETDDYIQAVEKLQENIVVLQGDLIALEESDLSDVDKEAERANIEADIAKDTALLSKYTTEAIKEQIDIVGNVEASEAMAGSVSPDKNLESNSEIINSDSESDQQKAEYLSLKHDFKNSQKAYNKALEEDYAARGTLSKIFGLGRTSMSPQVQAAHSVFMEANSAYHKFAQSSGTYQKISERMNREQNEGEKISINPQVFDRHVLKPAEQRLELQTLHLPESVLKLKTSLMEKIKANPKTAIGIGGLAIGAAAVFNLPGLVAGMATRNATKWAGDKYIGSKERKLTETKEGMVETIDGEANLEKMEAEYFKGLKEVRTAENYTTAARRIATSLAAAGVGAAYSGSVGAENIDINESLRAQEIFEQTSDINLESIAIPNNTSELIHVVEQGDTTSEIINSTVRERLAAGELVLPKGVNENSISHWLYQSFPELTNASHVPSRLTPSEWMDIGVSSGNPQDIKLGEMIDVETLLEKMRGMDSVDTQLSQEVSPNITEEAVENAKDIYNTYVDVPVQEAPVVVDVSPEVSVGAEAVEQIPDGSNSADLSPESNDIKLPNEVHNVQTSYESEQSGGVYEAQEDTLPTAPATEKVLEMAAYTPYISEKLVQQSHQFVNPEPGSLHKYLAETMLKEYKGHSINLPIDTAVRVFKNESAIYGFIEKNIPDLSTNWLSKTLRGGPDLFTSEDWVNFGIKSGDPTNITPGESVKTGEIIKKLLEIAGNKVNKI